MFLGVVFFNKKYSLRKYLSVFMLCFGLFLWLLLFCLLIVVSSNGKSNWDKFLKHLEDARIKPSARILDLIAERHYNGIDPNCSSQNRACSFYYMVKNLLTTTTVAIIADQLSLHVNGPVVESKPNILSWRNSGPNCSAGARAHGIRSNASVSETQR